MRSLCSVCMFTGGMEMQSWQKQQGREESDENSRAPG